MDSTSKTIATNRKAYFEYFLSDALEAGIVLSGSEIKSIRQNGCSLQDSYVVIRNQEVYLLGMHIAPYAQANLFNHDPTRTRKLLLHEKEIRKYAQKVKEKGFTIIATKVYFSRGKVKVEIALAKGKKLYDKRETQKKKDLARENEKIGRIK